MDFILVYFFPEMMRLSSDEYTHRDTETLPVRPPPLQRCKFILSWDSKELFKP